MTPITREIFLAATGSEPKVDDLDRCNCSDAGKIGHFMCGWDAARNMPRFMVPLFEASRPTTPGDDQTNDA